MKNIVVVGPGGLGGPIAASLSRNEDVNVSILGRPGAHVDLINTTGLRVTGHQNFTAKVKAFDDPKHISACDDLIFTTKAHHTTTVLSNTAHITVNNLVVSLQNGVDKDQLLAETFGPNKVIGGLTVIAAERTEPGLIHWAFDGGTQFGELDGTESERVNSLVNTFTKAGMITQSSNNIVSETWSKLVGWLPLGLLSVRWQSNAAGVLATRSIATEYLDMVRELKLLTDHIGVSLVDKGPYRVATWCKGSTDTALEHVMTSPLTTSNAIHSAFQDIKKGIVTEFSSCVGPILEKANKASVAIPNVQSAYSELMALEATL